ncbi:cation:proton antiporter [Lichenihabitans psoromatis]|uniref:cation:proton antiporter n=1 Tax=Lichenihabitans psoromatis TaxID=2528642 RepID=UPI00103845FE|nr:sodium:proton antiporter [Lichenihabitans psoromatis]
MELFELVIGLLIGAALLTTLSTRVGAPYPVVLAVAGAALALLPTEKISARLDPDLALALFVAPVLLNAAFDTSPRDLKANWAPVFSLVMFCVVVTVAAVAVVARWLVPDMPWAVAIALGAIVAPPDATAATSILRLIAPPHRMMVILEGESLLNDASALLIYRFAVGAALGASVTPFQAIPALLFSAGGGVLLGIALGWLFPFLTRRVEDIPVHVSLQFAGTFAVWIVAETIGVSPILTVVAYAIMLSQVTARDQTAGNRRASFAVWDVAIYVLNALAFILVGLQLHPILRDVSGKVGLYAGFSAAVLATVILARIGWVMIYNRGLTLRRHLAARGEGDVVEAPSLKASIAVSWCGMRGVVTLATALALPYGDGAQGGFPYRDLLITAAFAVVLGTLVIQGLTLGPMLRWFDLADDGESDREEKIARRETARSAFALLKTKSESEADLLRREYAVRMQEQTTDHRVDAEVIGGLRMEAIAAERGALDRLRRNRTIGDDTYRTIEEELDWAEGHAVARKDALAELGPLDKGAPDEKV